MENNIYISELTDASDILSVVDIHMDTFEGFFLTVLGRDFLNCLYSGFVEHPESGLIIAKERETAKVIGFLAYSESMSSFYSWLLRDKFFKFFWYSIKAVFKSPKSFFRLLRALTYPSNSKSDDLYIELSSIGVLNNAKSKGIGTFLLKTLIDKYSDLSFKYIRLSTDKVDNEYANSFYKKNGFSLSGSYKTPEGREMNEYRYILKKVEV